MIERKTTKEILNAIGGKTKMVKSEEWYRSKISAIADIVEEIQKDSKKVSFNRIMTDVETWEASRIRE